MEAAENAYRLITDAVQGIVHFIILFSKATL